MAEYNENVRQSINALFEETNITNFNDKVYILVSKLDKFAFIHSLRNINNIRERTEIDYEVQYDNINGVDVVRDVPEVIFNVINNSWTQNERHLLTVIMALFSWTSWKNLLGSYAGILFRSNDRTIFYRQNHIVTQDVLAFDLSNIHIDRWIIECINDMEPLSYTIDRINIIIARCN